MSLALVSSSGHTVRWLHEEQNATVCWCYQKETTQGESAPCPSLSSSCQAPGVSFYLYFTRRSCLERPFQVTEYGYCRAANYLSAHGIIPDHEYTQSRSLPQESE